MAKTRRRVMGKKETEKQRAVAISKRRKGLFNKAAELSMVGDARVAVLISAPSKSKPKFYSFGYPSVDTILHDFLVQGSSFRDSEEASDSADKHHERLMSLSLWRETMELERDIEKQESKKKITKGQPPLLPNVLENFPHAIEEESEKCKSVKELQPLVAALEKLRDEALRKLHYSQNSLPDHFAASTSTAAAAAVVAATADADNNAKSSIGSGNEIFVPKNAKPVSDSFYYIGNNNAYQPEAGKTEDRISPRRASASGLNYGGNFISFSRGNGIGIGNNQSSSSSPSSSMGYSGKNSFSVGMRGIPGPNYYCSRTIHSNNVGNNYFPSAKSNTDLVASSFIHCYHQDYEDDDHHLLNMTNVDKSGSSSKTPSDDRNFEQPFVVASNLKGNGVDATAVPGSQFDAQFGGNWGTSKLDDCYWNLLTDDSTAKSLAGSGLDDNIDLSEAARLSASATELEDFILDFM